MSRNTQRRRNHSTLRRQDLRRFIVNGPYGHEILHQTRLRRDDRVKEIFLTITKFGILYYGSITIFNNLNAVWDRQFILNSSNRKQLFRGLRKNLMEYLNPEIKEVEARILRKHKEKNT